MHIKHVICNIYNKASEGRLLQNKKTFIFEMYDVCVYGLHIYVCEQAYILACIFMYIYTYTYTQIKNMSLSGYGPPSLFPMLYVFFFKKED